MLPSRHSSERTGLGHDSMRFPKSVREGTLSELSMASLGSWFLAENSVISAPALKFAPPNKMMEVTSGSTMACEIRLWMWILVSFPSGFNGFCFPLGGWSLIICIVIFVDAR